MLLSPAREILRTRYDCVDDAGQDAAYQRRDLGHSPLRSSSKWVLNQEPARRLQSIAVVKDNLYLAGWRATSAGRAHRAAAFVPISVLLIAATLCGDEQDRPHVMCDGRDADTIRDARRRLPMSARYTSMPRMASGTQAAAETWENPPIHALLVIWWGPSDGAAGCSRWSELCPRSSAALRLAIVDGRRSLDVLQDPARSSNNAVIVLDLDRPSNSYTTRQQL